MHGIDEEFQRIYTKILKSKLLNHDDKGKLCLCFVSKGRLQEEMNLVVESLQREAKDEAEKLLVSLYGICIKGRLLTSNLLEVWKSICRSLKKISDFGPMAKKIIYSNY